uniref:Uncharacterized protein n=1 Tax=Oryctolagus cuniculus TaxID=9986 RepID=A0A5F9CCN2_RABIT
MYANSWKSTKISSSPQLIPEWKNMKLLIDGILKDIKIDEESKNDAVVLSDWPKILYQESHHPKNKPFVCFYSINVNYFVSLNWMEPYGNKVQAVLWMLKKGTEKKEVIEKTKFHVVAPMPPIEAMVHTGSYHTLIAYCGDMHLWVFGDHQQAFTSLGTVPCRFSISCLCYDSETKMLLSGTLGAIITWFILPSGRDLQMAQTVPITGHELVQSFSLTGPQDSLLALCENAVRVFTHQGQGQLKEVKKFTLVTSGTSITCCFTCVSQGTLYAGNRAGEIHAWGLERSNFLHSFQAHSSSVICVHSRPETYTLLTAGGEGVVREWNLASGSLLRQLSIYQDLRQLQFIDDTTLFCQSTSTFSLHRLPYFYNLFHVCGSAPQDMQRVCCGHNWTRILCATEDGLLRFLSPVTGDLLVITWPLLVMDKAVAWAYDSERQELFVATGNPEVLVFDATRSPCTAKYLVYTSGNSTDRVRCLAYGRSRLGKGLDGLMFCGHESGIVRILSHHRCARIEKTVHSGAVLTLSTLENPQENSLLCSYGKDDIIHLTKALLQEDKVILQPFSKIICVCPLKHVILLPGSVGAITETCCWCLWHYQDFPTSSESKQSPMFRETKCLHECDITSFDVCFSLELFVTRDIDGSVRIWDFHGRLVTELDSALRFGPLCFANNRGDLLLTFNQSIYVVSCLKLLPPAQLIHLGILNTVDEIQEVPKPFLPSFFFLFEKVLVPKFVYLGQGLQEFQGLEILINKRGIAFDNTVPHVVEEERRMSFVIQERPKRSCLEEMDINMCTLDPEHHRPPYVAPAQLQLAGWEGFNPYHIVRRFFSKRRPWPFTPDGYIPNSVIRACLWPKGTSVFLSFGIYSLYQDKDGDMTELGRVQALPPETLEGEEISLRKQKAKFKEWKRSSFDLESMTNQNWMGRNLSEGFIEDLIENILSLTIYCSVENYKKYFSVLAQIFTIYQIPSRLYTETAYQLLKDTTHSNPHIRELAWEMLERLGIMNDAFAIPLAMGLMDSEKNVRTKVLHLMTRVIGIQTKTMLIHLLKKPETLQKMQMEIIGDITLGQLLDIQASDIQCLLTQVEQQLNENLTLSYKDRLFSFDLSRENKLNTLDEEPLRPLSETQKISEQKKRKRRVQAKSRKLIKNDVRVVKKQKKIEFRKVTSVLVPSKDAVKQSLEQRVDSRPEQIDTQHVAPEPEPPQSTFIPVKSQIVAKKTEVVLKVKESTESLGVKEAMEVTETMEVTDQYSVEVESKDISKLDRREHVKELWKRAIKKGRIIAIMQQKEKKDLKDISEATTEEPMEEFIQVSEQEKYKRKKPGKSSRGLAGAPGRKGKLDTSSWRDDICYLVTSRITGSDPDVLRDLSKELVDLARVMLADRQPSWDLFQEICPLLEDSRSFSSKLDGRIVQEQPIMTETVVKGAIKDEGKVISREKGGTVLKTKKAKRVSFLEDHLILEKQKFKTEVRKPAKQEGKIVKEEKKLKRPEEKIMQGKKELTKDEKKLTHLEEKPASEEEILASLQKKLTTEEQKQVLEKRRLPRKERKPLGKGKEEIQKEGKPTLGWEKIMQVQEESIRTKEKRKLSWKEKKLHEEEELAREEEKLTWEKEELAREEEEVSWEEEELAKEEEEELSQGIEKRVGEKKKHIQEKEKPFEEEEEEIWTLEELSQDLLFKEEELLGEERKQALERGRLAEQENKLTQEEKKQSGKEEKEARKKEQIQEKREKQVDEQETQDQIERQTQKEKKEAKKNKQLALKRKKLDLVEDEKFEEVKRLSQKDKEPWKKSSKTREKERRAQKKEKTTVEKGPLAWGKEELGLEKEEPTEEIEEWSKEKEKQARRGKKQTLEEQRRAWEEEKLAQRLEKEAEKIKVHPRAKMKPIPEKEKMMEEADKRFPKEAKQDMKTEKQAKKEEELVRQDEKEVEKKTQWIREEEKITLQEEKLPQKKGIWSQRKEKWFKKEEKEAEQKSQWGWGKEKLSLDKFQEKKDDAKEKEKMILDKRMIPKYSELAKKKKHVTKKERAVAKEITVISKRRRTITQEEKEIMKKEDQLFQDQRKLAYDIKIKERDVTKGKKKLSKQEIMQARRKLDMEKELSSIEKEEPSSRGKNAKMKENQLLMILAGIVRELSTLPLKKTEITEEERSSIMRSETDGHRWEFFKGQKEMTEEEKEQVQKERELDDDRMATRERTLTEEESLEEDKRLLEEVQEKIIFNKIQIETILKEAKEQNLLDKQQLEELVKRIEENDPEKTQAKWLLENIREIFYEGLIEKEIEEDQVKKEKVEESPIEEEIKEERKYLKKKKKIVSPSEEGLEEMLAKKHKKKSLAQKRRKEKRLAEKKKRLGRKEKEEKERLTKDKGEHPSEEEESSMEEEEDGIILPKKESKKYLIKQKGKKISLREEELEEDLAKKHKKKSLAQKRKKEKRSPRKEKKLRRKKKERSSEERFCLSTLSREEG